MTLDIESYYEDLMFQVDNSCSALGGFSKNHFTEVATNQLAAAEEVLDAVVTQFEGLGKNRRKAQIDAYSFDEADGTISLVASDYVDSPEIQTITMTEITSLFDALESFLEIALDDELLERLASSSGGAQAALDLRYNFTRCTKFRLYIVTNRRLSSRVKSLETRQIRGFNAELVIWDIQRFFAVYSSTLQREETEIDFQDWVPAGIPALRYGDNNTQDFETYLAVVPGKLLAELYRAYGSRILEGNVRSFLSVRGSVNKGIRNTVLREAELFLAYNNGLAATASAVESESLGNGIVLLKSVRGLQIVNGGQTTVTLYNYLNEEKEKSGNLDKVSVQMKLVAVQPDHLAELQLAPLA